MSACDSDCYAVRRLNPYLGVTEVVETADARALSMNGRSWQLQVLTERPEHTWGSLNQFSSRKQFFRFGLWDPDIGVTRVPVNPVLNIGAMLRAAEDLVARLPAAMTRLPFPIDDRFELWQVDQAGHPLALVAATTRKRFISEIQPEPWQATLPAGTPFVSAELQTGGIAVSSHGSHRYHADLLEAQIRRATDDALAMRWFERRTDGSADVIDSERAVTVPAEAFPETGVRYTWEDPAEQALINDYLDWLAPRLLMLPTLPIALRQRLEQAARSQAVLVDASYRLYPEVLDSGLIEAARVEARLRQAASA